EEVTVVVLAAKDGRARVAAEFGADQFEDARLWSAENDGAALSAGGREPARCQDGIRQHPPLAQVPPAIRQACREGGVVVAGLLQAEVVDAEAVPRHRPINGFRGGAGQQVADPSRLE